MHYRPLIIFAIIMALFALLVQCNHAPSQQETTLKPVVSSTDTVAQQSVGPQIYYTVTQDVRIKDYFRFMQKVVSAYDSLLPYPLDEYLIARSNPRLIDSLAATDYYERLMVGDTVYDQTKLVVLHQGDSLLIPDSIQVTQLLEKQKNTVIDINIPEFRLRIIENSDTLYSFPVRVGQHKKKYWEVTKRTHDLRTKIGVGQIIWINRYPKPVDPQSGKKYDTTLRDDGKRTKMPQIPWIEPSINSNEWGQMIHPTTNPKTLDKAYSNGCIGTREADAWRIYYYAPIGTKVVIRYDLEIQNEYGETIELPDIYGWKKKK